VTARRRTLIDWLLGRPSDGDRTNNNSGSSVYRKCPQCGDRNFRVSDRQLARPDVFGSRSYRLKWICGACSHQEFEIIEEAR